MPPTTRSTKKQAKNKKQRKTRRHDASSPTEGETGVTVEHAGQEHLNDFLKQITKLAPVGRVGREAGGSAKSSAACTS